MGISVHSVGEVEEQVKVLQDYYIQHLGLVSSAYTID